MALIEGYFDGKSLKGPKDVESLWAKEEVIKFEDWLNTQEVLGLRFFGYDIARKGHLSAIWILEEIGTLRFTRLVLVLERCPFWFQKQVLFAVCRMPNFRRGCIDSTGIGANLAEDALHEFGKYKIEEINFGSGTKEDMAIRTRTAYEDKTVFTPADETVRSDLNSIKKLESTGKHARYDAKATDKLGHGDRFWSLSLSLLAAGDNSNSGPIEIRSAGRRESIKMLENY